MELYQKGTSQYLQAIVQNEHGNVVHGATVHAQVYRDIDGYYWDAATNTFISSGGNPDHLLQELGNTGIYRKLFDQSIDNNGATRHYTVLYSVSAPYNIVNIDTMYFYDITLDDIKGDGWEQSPEKPNLMNIANKDQFYSFNPSTDSLEALEEGGGAGGGSTSCENYNTEAC